jgi:hypothetical protein
LRENNAGGNTGRGNGGSPAFRSLSHGEAADFMAHPELSFRRRRADRPGIACSAKTGRIKLRKPTQENHR